MDGQGHKRRPPQHRRRPPQPDRSPEPEKAETRPERQPSKPPKKPLSQAAAEPPKRPDQPKKKRCGQPLNTAKRYARRGLKRAEHGLFQAKLAMTRAKRRAARRKQNRQESSQIGEFSIGGRKKRRDVQKTARLAVMAVLICATLWSGVNLIGFAARYVQTSRLEKQLSALHSELTEDETPQTPAPVPTETPIPTPAPTQTDETEPRQSATPAPDVVKSTQYQRMGGTPLAQMEALHEQNTDLVAWLTIDNVLDLPVVYRNNNYYLTHDFNQNQSTAGTVFLDENHPMTERTQNLLLHGHNMKDGTMFGRLAQYEKNLEYFKAHAFIDFSTLWHQEQYIVFAVLNVSLDTSSDRFLDYFAHPTFESDQAFERYIRQVQLSSLYAVPIDVSPSDALLTLSTCLDEDRLVLVARRRREGENKASLREAINMAVRQ